MNFTQRHFYLFLISVVCGSLAYAVGWRYSLAFSIGYALRATIVVYDLREGKRKEVREWKRHIRSLKSNDQPTAKTTSH